MNSWQFHFSIWQGVGPVWAISISFFFYCIELLVWEFPQSRRRNITYCLKSSLLLAFCFLLNCAVDQTQLCPSSISLLGLFQEIICNTERLKGARWSPELLGRPKLEGGPDLKGGTSDPSAYHDIQSLVHNCHENLPSIS